jgi:uncharacterized protein
MLTDKDLKETLSRCRTIAVVGISPKEDRPSYLVAAYLQSKGYRIIPVRPDGDSILGERVYRSLTEIPSEMEIDVVDIFRKSEDVPPVVEEALRRGVKIIWMQEGIVSEDAARKVEQTGATVFMDRCIKKEHQRLF